MQLDIVAIEQASRSSGKVTSLGKGKTGIFDAQKLSEIDRLNFRDLHMAARWQDALRNRPDRCPVLWSDVRSALFSATHRINSPMNLRILYSEMKAIADKMTGKKIDLTEFAERVICEPLLGLILGGMSPKDQKILLADQSAKIANVLYRREHLLRGIQRAVPFLKTLSDRKKEVSAGRVVSRHIRARAAGKRPAQDDYLQAIMGILERLGVSRATYVMTTILTAIAGAPGTVAACAIFELVRHPDWAERIREELATIPISDIFIAPVRSAPVTYRFIREVMRLWSFPLIVGRPLFKSVSSGDLSLREGEMYFLSAYVMHRDPKIWANPETFDPDRWLGLDASSRASGFSPFGWGPRTCVGASLGLHQYFLFMRMLVIDFKIECLSGGTEYMGLDGIAAPTGFFGMVRSGSRGEEHPFLTEDQTGSA